MKHEMLAGDEDHSKEQNWGCLYTLDGENSNANIGEHWQSIMNPLVLLRAPCGSKRNRGIGSFKLSHELPAGMQNKQMTAYTLHAHTHALRYMFLRFTARNGLSVSDRIQQVRSTIFPVPAFHPQRPPGHRGHQGLRGRQGQRQGRQRHPLASAEAGALPARPPERGSDPLCRRRRGRSNAWVNPHVEWRADISCPC